MVVVADIAILLFRRKVCGTRSNTVLAEVGAITVVLDETELLACLQLHSGEIIGTVVAWLQRDGFCLIPRAASNIFSTFIFTPVIHRPVCSGLDSGTNDLNGIVEFDIVRTGGNIQREGIRVVLLLLCFGQQGVDGLHLVLALPIIRSFETFIIASTCEVGRATAGRNIRQVIARLVECSRERVAVAVVKDFRTPDEVPSTRIGVSLPLGPTIHVALAAEHKEEVVERSIHLRHVDIVDDAVDYIFIIRIVIDHRRHLLERFIAFAPEAIGIELLVSSSRICRIGLLLHSANDIISRLGSIIDIPACERPTISRCLGFSSIIKYNLSRSSLLIWAHSPQIIGLAIILRRCSQLITIPICCLLIIIAYISISVNIVPSGRLLDIAERAVVIRKVNRRRRSNIVFQIVFDAALVAPVLNAGVAVIQFGAMVATVLPTGCGISERTRNGFIFSFSTFEISERGFGAIGFQ